MRYKSYTLVLFLFIILTSCKQEKENTMEIEKTLFGKLSDGSEVYNFTLKNKNGLEAIISEYGATVISLLAPDRSGKFEDIVLGYDKVEEYKNGTSYFGAIVGRYGNRIGKGKFSIDGKEYQLTVNDGENHLHGGNIGYNKVLWKGEKVKVENREAVKFTYTDPDGTEGYPGTVNITVIYTLTDDNELVIDYSGTTNKPTIFNPTHHSYFNLTGSLQNTILDHELMLNADNITPVDIGLITTGELMEVENTPMDFTQPIKIGARIESDFEQLKFGKGYDHNWVVNDFDGSVKEVATLFDPISGRYMEVLSDQPGIQFYSGNFLDGSAVGKNGEKYNYRTGLCLETQVFPDAPNKPEFPSARLNPGDTYTQTTIYKFSTK